MSTTILEALQNAEINLNNGGICLVFAKEQLHNGVALLEKGYSPHDDFNEIIEKYGSVDDAPEKA